MRVTAFRYASIVALGGLVFGLDAAIISGTVKFISTEFNLSDLEIGAVVSAPGFGVLFALLIAGILADKLGRKRLLQWIAFIYLISATWSAFSPDVVNLLIARFIGGFAFTSLSLSAMYIGEIAPARIRGKLVAMNQISIVVGLSAAYFINYLILQAVHSGASWVIFLRIDQYTWRWMLGSEILPAFIWFCLLFTIPRSPRWLILKARIEEARRVMRTLMPIEKIEGEIEKIQHNIAQTKEEASIRTQLTLLFSPVNRKALLIGITFAIVQQITGINAILFYAPTVFEQLGIGTDAAFMQAVFVGIISLIFTFLALALIDKVGRRAMTLWGLSWAVCSLAICAYGFHTATYQLTETSLISISKLTDTDVTTLEHLVGVEFSSDVAFKHEIAKAVGEKVVRDHGSELIQLGGNLPVNLILGGILSFIAAFQFSVGPIMWVVFSEIFSTRIRAVAIPTFAFVTSLVSYLIQQFFPWQLSHMGARDIFLFYSITSAIGLVILYKLLPETKNKTLEAIEAMLSNEPDKKWASVSNGTKKHDY